MSTAGVRPAAQPAAASSPAETSPPEDLVLPVVEEPAPILFPTPLPPVVPLPTVQSPDGRLVRNGVTRQLLQNGQAVTMEGNVVLLRDDMLTPAAIARADKAATGGSTTTISIPVAANMAALVPQFEVLYM